MIEKLIKIQAELRAPKTQVNTFGKYKYRSCEDIIEAVKPLLAREGLLMTISDEIVNMGDRFYVKATVTVLNLEVQTVDHLVDSAQGAKYFSTSDGLSVSAYAREEETIKGMQAAQITGAASSYARKYALNGMFAIDDTKDADSTNTHGKTVREEEPPAESEEELDTFSL